MKNLIIIILIVSTIMKANSQDVNGRWEGKLKVQGTELTIVFNVSKDDAGYSATMDSPDQGATGIQTENVKFENNTFSLEASVLKMNYSGNLSDDFTNMTGIFKQGSVELPLDLKKKDEDKKNTRPQTPTEPFAYKVEEVKYENKKAGIILSGTLTLPESGTNFPAVILISGSGPQNRDEELFDHKPFLVIADALTKQGIAVLRFDDRGVGESGGEFKDATSEDFADDVMAGFEFLKTRKEINHVKIGLIGHSEGGMIAPIVASKTGDVAFVVLMAGPGIPVDELMILQSEKGSELAGADSDMVKKNSEIQRGMYKIIKNNYMKDNLDNLLRSYMKEAFKELPAEMLPPSEQEVNNLIEAQIKRVTTKWFQYFICFNPQDYLSKLTCPLLALNGSLDSQVLSEENLEGIEKSLKKAGNKQYKIVEFDGMNHLFQKAETGAFTEYNQIEQTHSQLFLDTLTNWVLETTKR